MPFTITHQLIAEEVFRFLAEKPELKHYYFGAQGGDIAFFYGWTEGKKHNLGQQLHRGDVYGTLNALLTVCDNPLRHAYALGYLTHYAADTVFHPYVYAQIAAEQEKGQKGNIHFMVEGGLDVYFYRTRRGESARAFVPPYTRQDLSEPDLYAVYSAFGHALGKTVKQGRFHACLDRYFLYLRHTADRKGRQYRFWSGVEERLHLPHQLSPLYRPDEPQPFSLNLEGREWHYPAAPEIRSCESADDLFARATEEGISLIGAFEACRKAGSPLPRELFSKNFLTGI